MRTTRGQAGAFILTVGARDAPMPPRAEVLAMCGRSRVRARQEVPVERGREAQERLTGRARFCGRAEHRTLARRIEIQWPSEESVIDGVYRVRTRAALAPPIFRS